MDSFLTDLRYGFRMLRKTPGLSLVAVFTIALGVGLTTHTFSAVYGSVIRGLDFNRGTQLVSLSEDIPSENSRGGGIPYLDMLDWREEQQAFKGLAAFTAFETVNLADEGAPPERFDGAHASANLFEQVDGDPLLGRVFTPDEADGSAEPVVIISHDVWMSRYAGAQDIIGRTVRANSEAATIVGVMPEGFHFPFEADVWLPLGMDRNTAVRGGSRVGVVGRLREGVSMEQADVQMQAIAARIADEYPETNEGVRVWVQPFEDSFMPPAIVAILWVMLVAVFGVLLIACFNVANLLLARSTQRSREIALRSAMGADRARIIRQLLMEATILAMVGSAFGIVIAYIGIESFNAAIVDIQKPYWIDVRLDVPALLFTLAITAFAAVAAGTLPAVRASGGKIHEILQDESRGSSGLRLGRFSNALVIGEIALSCALLVAAGMMIKSVINVSRYDLGFQEEGLFTARLDLFDADYPDEGSRLRFYDRLLQELAAEPEAEVVGLTTSLPAVGSDAARIAVEGEAYPDIRDQPISNLAYITPGYLEALGVELSEGRTFDDRDREGSVLSAIVNRSFAETHFGSDSPLGRRFRMGREGPWLTIVGLIPDVYVGGGVGGIGSDAVLADQFFLPIAQGRGIRAVSLAVKTRGEPGEFAGRARSVVASLDRGLPLYYVRTMEESIATGTWVFTVFGSLFTIFGIAALFLASVGLYGVMAFSVSRRTQEMGIRMALGAETRGILGLVLTQGMKQLGFGAAIGLAMGAVLARPMALVFFDVEPSDPTVYASIVVALTLAGLAACLIPARRATRVQLVDALRPD